MGRGTLCGAIVLGITLLIFRFSAAAGEPDPGRDLFLKHCSSCHGKDGRGKGLVSAFLNVKPADLTLLKKGNKGVFPLSNVMSSIDGSRTVRAHGEPSMPVWGEVFEKEAEAERYQRLTSLLKVKAIAEYISTLQR